MQQHNDCIDALGFQNRNQFIGRLGLVEEFPTLDPGCRYERIGGLEGHSDEADLHAFHLLDPVRGQRRISARVFDIGGQPPEVGTCVWGIREVAAIDGMTAAILHSQQFGHSLIELMVADARDIETHGIQRFHRRFVMEEP